MADSDDLLAVFQGLQTGLAGIFEQIGWAEDEIKQAQGRHPDHADLLYHAFPILTPSSGMPDVEFVHRSHARELLDRLANGEDARPPTAAELCVICSETSLHAPLTSAGAGLYFRLWARAFPLQEQPGGDELAHYERMHGVEMDTLEREITRKATNRQRRLGTIECDGWHFGEQVTCKYAPTQPTNPAQPAAPGEQGALFG